jgi:hypothetical protein
MGGPRSSQVNEQDDEDFDNFEDVIDDFIARRFSTMSQVADQFPTRDGFIAQVMLLIEIALLGFPVSDEWVAKAKEMVDSFMEPGVKITDPPTLKWGRRVCRKALHHIHDRREADHIEHKLTCPNCNPPENRNN